MGDLANLANLDYAARVNRAIDHVTRNLEQPLSLDEVARVACFSPYHFHRIFRGVTGETLHAFVTRLRLERALHQMAHGPRRSLTTIALACGFTSSSDFSRSFKRHYGLSPRAFDLDGHRQARRGKLIALLRAEPHARLDAAPARDAFAVRIRALPARRVAYIRVFRPYEGGVVPAAERLVAWAAARGVDGQWLGYQWDDPELVPLELCRYDVAVEVPEGVAIDGEASEARFPPMTVAEIALAGPIDLEVRAIDFMYRTWLPSSGYSPDHQPGFEAWVGRPFAHGFEHFELALQLPITRD